MKIKLASARPFLKKINLQSHHSPWLPFKFWFTTKKNLGFTWCLLIDITTDSVLNLYSPTFGIQQDSLPMKSRHVWFDATTTFCFLSHISEHAPLEILSPRHFLSTSLSQWRASNTSNRSSKKEINFPPYLHLGCCFLCISTHHIEALPPCLIVWSLRDGRSGLYKHATSKIKVQSHHI